DRGCDAAIEGTKQKPSETAKVLDPLPTRGTGAWRSSRRRRGSPTGMRSLTAIFFHDEVFAKGPATGNDAAPLRFDLLAHRRSTYARSGCGFDRPGESRAGSNTCADSLEGRLKVVSPDYHPALLAGDLEVPPDIDEHRGECNLVSWNMEPGDVLIFHPPTLHG